MNQYNINIPDDLLCDNVMRNAYILRLDSYNDNVQSFLYDYFQMVIKKGVFLEKGLSPVTASDIEYFNDKFSNFTLDTAFIRSVLKLYLHSTDAVYDALSQGIYDHLLKMRHRGKNDHILKNTCIKFMCWIRRDLTRALSHMEKCTCPPKIICKGDLSAHAFAMLTIAAMAGCDVLIVEYTGSEYYANIDHTDNAVNLLSVIDGRPFPSDFSLSSLKKIRKPDPCLNNHAINSDKQTAYNHCVNAWISGDIFTDIKTLPENRGSDKNTICTVYACVNGVESKNTYLNDLYSLYMSIKNSRKPFIIDEPLASPSNAEINTVLRGNYRTAADLINDMAVKNIVDPDTNMQTIFRRAFIYVMTDYANSHPELHKIMTRTVYLLCWFKRYMHDLFTGRSISNPGCLIIYGGCKSDAETTFIKMIARCPCDVMILCPDLQSVNILTDDLLYERNFTESHPVDHFPKDNNNTGIGTVAYYASRELDEIMYTDSGLYKNYQYNKASVLTLKTIYEEIPILWEAGLQFRPGFCTSDNVVTIPVIMTKISGVKDDNTVGYWNEIHDLLAMHPNHTIVFKNQILIPENHTSCDYASAFIKNGVLDKNAIKHSDSYKYGFLKNEVQDHILDTLDLFLQMKIVNDQNSGGYIYRIIHIILNINGYILRLIQGFDFTAINPKIIYINTKETMISRDDSVLLAFLSKLGFDIVLYVPTGYQSAEKYLRDGTVNCLETGPYKFDMRIPDLKRKRIDKSKSLFSQLFKRQ